MAQSESASPEADKLSVTIGMASGIAPRYRGSDEYKGLLYPTFAISYGNFHLDPERGGGIEYRTGSGLTLDGSISWDSGRKEKDSSFTDGSEELRGMGEIRSSAVLDLSLAQEIFSWMSIDGKVSVPISGQENRGNEYRLGLQFLPLITDTDQVKIGTSMHIGDEDYNQTYFGVSGQQSRRTRFSAFTPKDGVYAHSLTLEWVHFFSTNWMLGSKLEATQYADDIRKSPIVMESENYEAGVALYYRF